MLRHSNFLHIWFFLLLFCLVFSQPAYSKMTVEYQGQVYSLELPTIKVNGSDYISVENLFKQIGGVEYYSPIMKKVNLFFGGKNGFYRLTKERPLLKAVKKFLWDVQLSFKTILFIFRLNFLISSLEFLLTPA